VSTAVRRGTENFPPEWARLERATEEASSLLGRWVQRARAAEEEVERLRRALDELGQGHVAPSEGVTQEIRRLKAENAALRSRMQQARKRMQGLMQRLSSLGVEP
jgi:predicted RNase H-like nuclease (RuvC/YqgF family)